MEIIYKVINRPSERSLGLERQGVLIKREAQARNHWSGFNLTVTWARCFKHFSGVFYKKLEVLEALSGAPKHSNLLQALINHDCKTVYNPWMEID